MLLGMFAIFSGDMTERAISGAGYWSTVNNPFLEIYQPRRTLTWYLGVSQPEICPRPDALQCFNYRMGTMDLTRGLKKVREAQNFNHIAVLILSTSDYCMAFL